MNITKRIACKNCKAHILGDRLFCSVSLALSPKLFLKVAWFFVDLVLLWVVAITCWAQAHAGKNLP